MPEKLLRISSNDKYEPESNSNSDFVVYLQEKTETQEIKYILIKEVQVPNVFYNIRDGKNGSQTNVLRIEETGQAPLDLPLPEGQYSITELITELQTLINANLVSGSVAISQTLYSKKVQFIFTGTTAIIYDSANGSPMAPLLGISATLGPGAVLTAQYLPDLQGYSMVYIHSQDLADRYLIDGDSGLVSVASMVSFHNTPFGGVGYKQESDDELAQIPYAEPRNVKRIKIILRDSLGNKLDIGTNEMLLILKVFY